MHARLRRLPPATHVAQSAFGCKRYTLGAYRLSSHGYSRVVFSPDHLVSPRSRDRVLQKEMVPACT
jgi:hypothetical protein